MPRPSRREQDKGILLSWLLDVLQLSARCGVISTYKPAPLSRRDIADVLRMVRNAPHYEEQTIIVHARDGHPVRLKGGSGMGWRH